MIVVRGTKKFLDRAGRPVAGEVTSSGLLGDWYVNVWFWRPQVAVFVNERSLIPVLVPLAPAASVVDRLPGSFGAIARRIGVTGIALEAELKTMEEWVLAKTASRSVLGIMNEFSHLADNYRWSHEEIDLVDLALWLSQVPCRPLFGGEGSPDRQLRALLR
jgi:hypothetical protein